MKTFKLKAIVILVVAVIFSNVSVFAQQSDDKEEKEEIFIIKESVNDDGSVRVEISGENIVIETSEDGNVEIFNINGTNDIQVIDLTNLEGLSDEMQEKLKNFHLEITDDAMKHNLKIILENEQENGEPVIIEWQGEGDIPEDVKKEMQEHGVIISGNSDHNMSAFGVLARKQKSNKACLGVMIGKTVKNENGVETVRGESDQGVTILDIIEDSGAEAAGLLKDDIITSVGGSSVISISDVLEVLKPYEGGETVVVEYLRNNQPAQVNATLKTCANNLKIKNFENFGDNDFEFDEEMNWVFENEEEGQSQHKRIIIIKKSTKNIDELEEAETVVEEDDGVSGIEDPDDTIFTSNEDLNKSLELTNVSLYPNPTAGNLNVEFTGEAVPTTVKIIDITGKVIYSEDIINFNGNYQNQIDLSNAPKGTLMLTVSQNDKFFAEKIVTQ